MAAISIAVVHSLAPDHYLPISTIGKSKGWSLGKTMVFSLLAACVHVTSSAILGYAASIGLNLMELTRGVEEYSPQLLIAFGLAYSLFSHLKPHRHVHAASLTALLLVLGLSPCIPLVPLMLSARSFAEMVTVAGLFSVSTVLTIMAMTYLSYRAYRPPGRGEMGDIVSGLIIVLTGVLTMVFGMKKHRPERGEFVLTESGSVFS